MIVGKSSRHWRASPIKPKYLLSPLKGGGPTYISALNEFHAYVVKKGFILDTSEDVDLALVGYMQSRSRSKNDLTLAALLKVYPPSVADCRGLHLF